MTSNYNQLYISSKRLGDLQTGDIFELSDGEVYFLSNQICKFNGLQIKHIGDCITGKVLEFDYKEWKQSKPARPEVKPYEILSGSEGFRLFDELLKAEIKQFKIT